MLQQTATPPSGPRGLRQSSRLNASRLPSRDGIQKRSSTPTRVDRDGDLVMDTGRGGSHRRGTSIRGSALRGAVNQRRDPLSSRISARPSRTGIDTSRIEKAVLRSMGVNDTPKKGPRNTVGGARSREKHLARPSSISRNRLDTIAVWGLKDSKASANPDGGVKDLIVFLERKATSPGTTAGDAVKIKKSHLEGDALIISVRPEDTLKISRLNQFSFAGAELKIECLHEHEATPSESNADAETPNTIDVLRVVLSRRYNTDAKLLDLSRIRSDSELVNIGMFESSSRESKLFPALMKICDGLFSNAREKEEAIVSVSLANNALSTISSVTTLAQTFPNIKNLDLSNNNIQSLSALDGWRWRFPKIGLLIFSGNPIESEEPGYKDILANWYPTLTIINNTQVRSDDIPTSTEQRLPLPVLGPSFNDEAFISENFVTQYFAAYDSDRIAVANDFYNPQSEFSLSINVSAPRQSDANTHKPASWDQYIKRSRNLLRVGHLPARMSRLYTGIENIQNVFTTLPATRHPNVLSEPKKWCIECHTIPGLPDLTGQSASGVGGLIVMVHGEFVEVDVSTGQETAIRSFDRTFILGPGLGLGRIRVVCDKLVLRAYGGYDAWQPEEKVSNINPVIQQQTSQYQAPPLDGPGAPGLQKEGLALRLSEATGMTLEYSGMCLEQSGWNLESAASSFEQAKANLPAEAFMTGI